VAVPVIIRMFVAPLPVFRLLFRLQLGEFPMGPVLGLQPFVVRTVFAVVPATALPTVAVVVSPLVFFLAVRFLILGLDAHGRNQGRTQQKRNQIPMQSLHVFLLKAGLNCFDPLVRLYAINLGRDCAIWNTSGISSAGRRLPRIGGRMSRHRFIGASKPD